MDKEAEELQLALAISQSEAEAKVIINYILVFFLNVINHYVFFNF